MTSSEETAFFNGTGQAFQASDLLLTVQMIGITLVIIYGAWIMLRAYDDWGKEFTKSRDVISTWMRAVFMMMVLIYLFST